MNVELKSLLPTVFLLFFTVFLTIFVSRILYYKVVFMGPDIIIL